MLLINNLTKVYNELDVRARVVALRNVTLTFPDTGLIAIVGPSGCGKTTLLNILSGIDQPTYGRVICDGEEIDFSSSTALDIYRSYTTSLVFQNFNLLADYNVIDNVKVALKLQGVKGREAKAIAMDALTVMGLDKLANRKITTLSGGQQQRVAIARAIAKDSKIVICDEPTGNLDSANADETFSFMKMCSENRLIIVVTHDESLAERYADRIITLSDGEVIADTIDDEKYRQEVAPYAEEMFSVDNRLGGGERFAKAIHTSVSKSSKFFKKSTAVAMNTMYSDPIFAKAVRKNLSQTNVGLKNVAGFINRNTQKAFNNIHNRVYDPVSVQLIKSAQTKQKHRIKRKQSQSAKCKKVHGLSFGNMMLIVKNNIARLWVFNIAIMLLLIMAFSLVSIFLSLNFYQGYESLETTYYTAGDYLVPISKFRDEPREEIDSNTGESYYEHGIELKYDENSVDDYSKITQLLGTDEGIYTSYFWNKNIQDYINNIYFSGVGAYRNVPYSIKELIVVDNFSKLKPNLLYGKVPTVTGEVLVYDYIVNSMLQCGIVGGTISNAVGQTFVDKQSGVTFTISGILKSNFSTYVSTLSQDDNKNKEYSQSYLTTLQVAFCTQETADILLSDSDYISIGTAKFVPSGSNTTDSNLLFIKKLKEKTDTSGVLYQNLYTVEGLYIDVKTACAIFDIPQSYLPRYLEQLFSGKISISMLPGLYTSISEMPHSADVYIAGVVDNEHSQDGVIYYYVKDAESNFDFGMRAGEFKYFYYHLSQNREFNKQILKSLWQENKSNRFYENNPDYTNEGYMQCSLYGNIIRESNYFLVRVRDLSRNVMIVVLVAVTIFIIIYITFNLKKFNYKVAVLKALGANMWHIITIFLVQIILMSLIAFFISVPLSYWVMDIVNSSFVSDYAGHLVFFLIRPSSLIISSLVATVGVFLIVFVPLVRLSMAPPIKVIRSNKNSK